MPSNYRYKVLEVLEHSEDRIPRYIQPIAVTLKPQHIWMGLNPPILSAEASGFIVVSQVYKGRRERGSQEQLEF